MVTSDQQVGKTWKPTAAGTLDIICAALGSVLTAIFTVAIIQESQSTGKSLDSVFFSYVIIPILLGALTFAGAILALKRKRWWLAFIGSICAPFFLSMAIIENGLTILNLPLTPTYKYIVILSIFVLFATLTLIPLVLIILARNEFDRAEYTDVKLVSPGDLEYRQTVKTWKPTVAGILEIITGALNLFSVLFIFFIYQSLQDLPKFIIVMWLGTFGILAIVGGFFSLRRKRWPLSLSGSVVSFFNPWTWEMGLAAIILTVLSRDEFR